jgi:peptide chain release factor subunit 3
METWEQAEISNTIPEEKQDGKTRESAKLQFILQKKRFTLFDAPGSKEYLPDMIMTTTQADIAVLVVSAKAGEFELGFGNSGQTRQQALLAKTLGISELIVVISKMRAISWNQ